MKAVFRPALLALCLLAASAISSSAAAAGFELSCRLKLLTPAGYLPGLPFLARVELRQADGTMAREVWDADVTLSTPTPDLQLSTNRVRLANGLGSVLITASNGGDFELVASLDSLQASRQILSLSNQPIVSVGGTLSGSSTTWSGVIRVTNDVTVPAGHVLTIESNTWVIINGVASGTTANDLLISGTIESLGTEDFPVTITCANPGLRWGQIRHNNAQPSVYRHTIITLAGRAPGEGHTSTAPIIRSSGSRITFEGCSLTDHAEMSRSSANFGKPGKIGQGSSGASLTFTNCLLARARMGPEIGGTALLCVDTWFMDMRGPDDADGIYLHDQQAGQTIAVKGSVFAGGDDDGIDTLGSTITVEDCIIRDWNNLLEDAKGISVFGAATHIRRSLIVNSTVGVSAKCTASPASVLVSLDHCTLSGNLTNVLANKKSNAPGPNVHYNITNCILWGETSVVSDFELGSLGSTNFSIYYSDITHPWDNGANNLTNAPMFANAASNDYHLLPYSPCIDAGDPASPLDADGSVTDLGCFTFAPPPPWLGMPGHAADGFRFSLEAYPNRLYRVERSPDCQAWTTLTTVFTTNAATWLEDPGATTNSASFYRARLGP